MEAFELNAEKRRETGSAASRRLRKQGRVPAIIYGGEGKPLMVTFDHNELTHRLDNEAFFSHVINITVDGGRPVEAVLRDLQRHPARPFIEHADFLRIVATEKLRMSVPVHVLGAEDAPGVKTEGGIVQHMLTEVEIECLPGDLPENIELDISELELHGTVHLSELSVPQGVDIVALAYAEEDEDVDSLVLSIQLPRAEVEEDEEAEAVAEGEQATDEATEGEASDDSGEEEEEE